MAKRNMTLQLEEEIVRRAKVLAARRGTSVSALLAHQVSVMVAADDRYEQARQRALAALDNPGDHGGVKWSREELYDL